MKTLPRDATPVTPLAALKQRILRSHEPRQWLYNRKHGNHERSDWSSLPQYQTKWLRHPTSAQTRVHANFRVITAGGALSPYQNQVSGPEPQEEIAGAAWQTHRLGLNSDCFYQGRRKKIRFRIFGKTSMSCMLKCRPPSSEEVVACSIGFHDLPNVKFRNQYSDATRVS